LIGALETTDGKHMTSIISRMGAKKEERAPNAGYPMNVAKTVLESADGRAFVRMIMHNF
jgi:hypothetical protein